MKKIKFIHFFSRTWEQIQAAYTMLSKRYRSVKPTWFALSGPYMKGWFEVR